MGAEGAHGGFSSMDDALKTFMHAFGGMGGGGGSIFDSLFGGGGGATQHATGASKKASIHISFEEAFQGTEKELLITRLETCDACEGRGAASPSDIQTCNQCSGQGQVYQTRGFFSMASPCPRCQGSGQTIARPCKSCHGAGQTKKKQHVKVPIPGGIGDGMRLRMAGYGDAGYGGGAAGDLYVFVHVNPHPVFKREGDDLLIELPITFSEAALGTKKELPTMQGNCLLTIPEGTQWGKIFRVKGKGFPNVHGRGKGDLLVTVTVETPLHLNEEQKNLLKKFSETEGAHNLPGKQNFLDKIKSFFS